MLLILMYHRVDGVTGGSSAFAEHLRSLAASHPLVLPGDPLPPGELSVCLTFDDATADFYHRVFPLLQALSAKALVAVPTAYVEADTDEPVERRLSAQHEAVASGSYAVPGTPLCTWRELREMQDSGRVVCASHSHTHVCLSDAGVDVAGELDRSRRTLEQQLGRAPDTFVYPYGSSSPAVHRQVAARYRYGMRIGTAVNRDWNGSAGLLYRVDAEAFWPDGQRWSGIDLLRYRLKYYGNRLRGV